MSSIVPDRPGTYNAALYWNEENGVWTATEVISGGNYKSQIVAIGSDDDGEGVIYFGGT